MIIIYSDFPTSQIWIVRISLSWGQDAFEIVLSFIFFYFLAALHMACGILVPLAVIKCMPPAMEAWCVSDWTARKIPGPPF